jgi:hypothetical protein
VDIAYGRKRRCALSSSSSSSRRSPDCGPCRSSFKSAGLGPVALLSSFEASAGVAEADVAETDAAEAIAGPDAVGPLCGLASLRETEMGSAYSQRDVVGI